MEWQIALTVIFGSLVVLMLTGMPIALCFLFINVLGAFLLFGWPGGLDQVVISIYTSLATFTIAPIPLFIGMGELMFHSGLGGDVVGTVDQWLGRLPGRQSLLAVGAGVLLATLTGASVASVSILSSTLVPDMEKRGYHKSMIFGPILSAGSLAVLIPPSVTAVLLASVGELSVGEILMAIIGPGVLLAALYAAYIVIVCTLHPSLAPSQPVDRVPLRERLGNIARNILPVAMIIFSVIGFMLLGIATPEEAAASGAIATLIVAAAQRRLSWEVIRKSAFGTLRITGMIFLIMAGAKGFSQVLSFTGATQSLSEGIPNLSVHPLVVMGMMQLVMIILGCFMDTMAIILITMPTFIPAINALGLDPIWFGAIAVVNLELGMITPPFGIVLYAMKAMAPPRYCMGDIIRSVIPFMGLQILAIAICIVFPSIPLWLVGR
ncbi:MAG: TRAP transporter large permease subunit [Thermodesulfobacteriota bacterium]